MQKEKIPVPDAVKEEGSDLVMARQKKEGQEEFSEAEKEQIARALQRTDIVQHVLENKDGGKHVLKDLSDKTTLHIRGCKNCHITLSSATIKVFVNGCEHVVIDCNEVIKTEVIEVWRCKKVTVNFATKIGTVQADLTTGLSLNFARRELLGDGRIVWGGVQDLDIGFGGEDESKRFRTGFSHVVAEGKYAELNETIDQFVIRLVNDNLLQEQIVRLENGFPTTQREADAWDAEQKKKAEAQEKYMRDLLKFAAPKLGIKDDTKRPAGGRNEPCPVCKSGKKYKNCCWTKYTH